ncbi:TPA: hypothetical protein H1009_02295 [archaeon]|nr:hypothetical protein [Candidatus Naiadarchaeales archaeon SRR2090153.bin461]
MSAEDCRKEGKRILKEGRKTKDSSLYLKASYYFTAAKDRESTIKCLEALIKILEEKLKKEKEAWIKEEISNWKRLLEGVKKESRFNAFYWLMFERNEHITDEDLERKQISRKSKEFEDVIVAGDAEIFILYIEEHPEEVLKARRLLRK